MNIINEKQEILPWYKEYFVWMILFFPSLAIVGGIATMILAIKSDDGLVVDDYYKNGLEINRTLERDQSAINYGLDANIELDTKFEEVLIQFTSGPDFVLPSNIEASFLHATRSGLDKEASLLLTDNNNYRGNLPELELGKWYVHIQHDDWRLIKTINVR